MGKITAIEYPDGKILQDIIEDETGGIFSARIVDPDGTSERIIQGENVEIRRPDGSVWNYTEGRLVKIRDSAGRSFVYLYTAAYLRVYEPAANSAYRYNFQGQYLQTDSGAGIPPASLDPLTFSLSTISYSDLATTATKTSTEQSSDFFKAKIISSKNGQITLETPQQDRLFYQGGKLVKEIEGGTDHAKEYSYEGTNTILNESGSVQSFDSQKNLFRFIDYQGNSYDVTPVLTGTQIAAYSLVSSAGTVRLDMHGQIQSVTGASVTQSQFLNIHFDLANTPLDISQMQIQGSAEVIKGGDFSMKIKTGANSQDTAAPQIYVTSPLMIDSEAVPTGGNSSYTLVYTVDGVQKTKAVTLREGKNLLDVTEQDASGNKTTVQFAVTYAPPVPFEEQNGMLVIEAEHPQADYPKGGNSWELETSQDGKSGEGYFVAGPDAAKVRDTDYVQNAPELQYKMQIQNPGTYYVWIRGYAPDGGSDSIHAGLDGQAVDTSDRIIFWPVGKWLWTNQTHDKDAAGKQLKAVMTVTAAGVHTLNVWMREDGLVFDKIILSQDPNFVPQDFGPDESRRNYTPPQTNPQGELLAVCGDCFADLAALVQDYHSAQMGADTVVYSVFDQDGKLVDTQKVDGTITQYSHGKIAAVWDRSGRLLQSYVYDSDGNPVKITLNQMRAEFPVKILQAREEVEKQKNEALRGLATQQQTAAQQIQAAFAKDRAKLESQRQNLQGQRFQTVCQSTFCFESCQTVENPGVTQAINQIDQNLSALSQQEAQAYANLQASVEEARVQIDTQVGTAFHTIDEQEKKFRDEIMRQEISPIIFNYYRMILGRDPNEEEYNRWITETDFNQGLDLVKLKQVLSGKTASGETVVTEYSVELAERTASVAAIKASVTEFMNDYKVRTQAEKIQIAQQFGLAAEDLASFTSAEADKVLSWLNTRSLHFGQSAFIALEQLLGQAGITTTREDLAKKLILIDILTGVINPFSSGGGSASGGDEGELVLSLFALKQAAKLYGLETEGMNVAFEDMAVFYQTHAGDRMIAHINGDHYVIVTGIANGKVTYTDPGAGPDGQNQVMEVSVEEFLKVWEGNVLMPQTTSAILLQQHEDDPNLNANPPPHVLTKPELQAVRGSFFFFLVPFFTFIFTAVVSVATAVAGVIGAAAAAIGAAIGPLMAAVQGTILGIVSGLQALAGAFLGFATSMLNAIPFVVSTLNGVVGTIGNFLLGFFPSVLTGTVSKFIVTAATTLLFSPGGIESVLTTIGFSPKVAHYIGMGIGIVGAVATGNPFLIASTLTSIAVTEIGPRIGLSPQLTAALSIAASALSGTIAQGYFDPNTTVFQALKNAAPKLVSSFAQAGIVGLGDAIGLDPRLTGLLSIPVSAGIGMGFDSLMHANAINRTSIFAAIKNGINTGASSVGLNFSGGTNSIFGSLKSADVLGSVESAIGKDGLFSNILNLLGQAALVPFNALSGSAAAVLKSAADFGSLIQSKGVAAAFESLATSIFSRQTIEKLLSSGGVGGFVSSASKVITTLNGQSMQEQKLTDTTSLFYNLAGQFIGKKENGVTQIGTFGVSSFGKWGLLTGSLYALLAGGDVFAGEITDGQLMNGGITGADGTKFVSFNPESAQGPIIINKADTGAGIFNGIVNFLVQEIKFSIENGTLVRVVSNMLGKPVGSIDVPGTSGGSINVKDRRTYLLNGIGNTNPVEDGAPEYMVKLRNILRDVYGFANTALVGLYEGIKDFGNEVLNNDVGILQFIQEFIATTLRPETQKVINEILSDLAAGTIKAGDTVNVIAHSGAGQRILEAAWFLPVKINLLMYGAPAFVGAIPSRIENIQQIWGTEDLFKRTEPLLEAAAIGSGYSGIIHQTVWMESVYHTDWPNLDKWGYNCDNLSECNHNGKTFLQWLAELISGFFASVR
ncbi:MAG TPA: cysteine peptidase family C39 domain-containing protein [bacterium]|nr:cysteine peptidase family C39 domain-containing protein [bacterium]